MIQFSLLTILDNLNPLNKEIKWLNYYLILNFLLGNEIKEKKHILFAYSKLFYVYPAHIWKLYAKSYSNLFISRHMKLLRTNNKQTLFHLCKLIWNIDTTSPHQIKSVSVRWNALLLIFDHLKQHCVSLSCPSSFKYLFPRNF